MPFQILSQDQTMIRGYCDRVIDLEEVTTFQAELTTAFNTLSFWNCYQFVVRVKQGNEQALLEMLGGSSKKQIQLIMLPPKQQLQSKPLALSANILTQLKQSLEIPTDEPIDLRHKVVTTDDLVILLMQQWLEGRNLSSYLTIKDNDSKTLPQCFVSAPPNSNQSYVRGVLLIAAITVAVGVAVGVGFGVPAMAAALMALFKLSCITSIFAASGGCGITAGALVGGSAYLGLRFFQQSQRLPAIQHNPAMAGSSQTP